MDRALKPTPSAPNVDLDGVLASVESNPQRLFEIAETFRQDAPKFIQKLASCIQEGRRDEATVVATQLRDLAVLMQAVPLVELTEVAILHCELQDWSSLHALLKTLETTIQGTVNLLRIESKLAETNRLPEPIEFPAELARHWPLNNQIG